MDLEHLGDALDYWKGSLFGSLHRSNVLRGFAVDPMASDWPNWKPEDVLLYTCLLRIDKAQLIPHTVCLASREQYFGEIKHTGDLFLDPDVGIATGKRKDPQHVIPAEIGPLLSTSGRLLAVYQHVRGNTSQRVDQVCHVLDEQIAWCSYESPTAAMIFLSRSHQRVAMVTAHFRRLLHGYARRRIRTNKD